MRLEGWGADQCLNFGEQLFVFWGPRMAQVETGSQVPVVYDMGIQGATVQHNHTQVTLHSLEYQVLRVSETAAPGTTASFRKLWTFQVPGKSPPGWGRIWMFTGMELPF